MCECITIIKRIIFLDTKEPLLIDNKNQAYLPADLISVVTKRFNMLVIIAGSVLTALLIMVFGGYLIYRVAFSRNDEDSSENGNNKKSNRDKR